MTPEEAERIERARADVHAILRAWKSTLKYDGRQVDFMHDALDMDLSDAKQLADLSERAKSDPHAFRLCLTAMHTFKHFDAELPESFNWLVGAAAPRSGKGGSDRKNARRDEVILRAIEAAITHQLPKYANGARKDGSVTAAELVADCLAEGDPEEQEATREPYAMIMKKASSPKAITAEAIKAIWRKAERRS